MDNHIDILEKAIHNHPDAINCSKLNYRVRNKILEKNLHNFNCYYENN